MKQVHKFLSLSLVDQSLLVESAVLLSAIKLFLWLLPFQTLLRLLARLPWATTKLLAGSQVSVDKVVWAVVVAGRYVPGATCLTRALATKVLLAGQGLSADLRIGVAKGQGGRLEAHAWVEGQGRILIGGLEDLSRYTPLRALEGGGL